MSTSHADDAATLARGAGWLVPGRLLGRAVSFLVGGMLIPRLLGPEGNGLFGMAFKVVLILGLFAALGLDNGVIRFASGGKERFPQRLVRNAIAAALISGLAMGLAVYVMAPWVAESVFDKPDLAPVLRVFAFCLVFVPGLRVAAASTRVNKRMRDSAVAEDIVQPLTQLLLVVALYWLGWQVLGAALATVLSYAVAFFLAAVFVRRLFPGFLDLSGAPSIGRRELLAFTVPTSLAGMLGLVVLWVDTLLVGYFLSKGDTGIYDAASRLTMFYAVVLSSFNHVFSPMIAELHGAGQQNRLNHLYRTATRWALLICLPLTVVIAIHPESFVTFLQGSAYARGAGPLVILAIGQLVNVATGAVGYLLIMSGRQKIWLAVTAAAVFLNVLLAVTLIPRFGITGAAVATSVALVLLFGCGLVLVRRQMKLWPWDRSYLPMLVASAVAVLALSGAERFGVPTAGWWVLVHLTTATLVIWFGAGLRNRELGVLGLLAALGRRN